MTGSAVAHQAPVEALPALRAELERRRGTLSRLASADATPAGLATAVVLGHAGLDLKLFEPERRLIEQLAQTPRYPGDWRGRTVDSILVAQLWNDLADRAGAAPDAASTIASNAASDAASSPALDELLAHDADLWPAVGALAAECHDGLARSVERIDGTSPTVEALLTRARERLRQVSDAASRVITDGWPAGGAPGADPHDGAASANGSDSPPQPAESAAPPLASRIPLDPFVTPVLDSLRTTDGDFDAALLRELRLWWAEGAAPALTEIEVSALCVLDLGEKVAAAAERQVFTATAALTLKAARDLGVLGGDSDADPILAADAELLIADLDAVESLLEVAANLSSLAKNQGRTRLIASLDPVARRLGRLRDSLVARIGPELDRFPRQRFEIAADLAELRSTGVVTARGTGSTRIVPKRTGPGERRERQPRQVARTLAVLGSLITIASTIGYGIYDSRAYLTKPAPASIASDAVQPFFPGARLLEVTAEEQTQGLVRIELDSDSAALPALEIRDRVTKLCQFLSSGRYERAEIVDRLQRPIAHWIGGHVIVEGLPANAPAPQA